MRLEKKNRRTCVQLRAVCLSVCAVTLIVAIVGKAEATTSPVGTTFTYQGRLTQSGAPVNGTVNAAFRLFDVEDAGTPLSSLVANNLPVDADGRFTIDLNFGGHFDGAPRWLQIEVEGEVLSPRQPIMAAPYAMVATTAASVPAKAIAGAYPGITAVGVLQSLNVSGNVSIGTTSPGATLEVGGSVISSGPSGGAFSTRNPNNQSASFGMGWLNDVARLRIGGNGAGAGGGLDIQRTGDASLMRILHNGDVGIGTTSPAGRLGIVTGSGTVLHLNGSGTSSVGAEVGGATIGVRINTTTTGTALSIPSITGSARAASIYGISSNDLFRSWNDGTGPAGLFIGQLRATGGTDTSPSGGGFFVLGDESTANISMDNNEIMARNNGSATSLHLNAEGGAVEIGSNSGGAGRLITPVIQITGGSDLSEQFDVATIDDVEPLPGMVVCIDPRNPGKLIPSTRAYDRTVAGVISGANGVKTGMIMGQHGTQADGAHAIALTGRVYVMVDANSGGAIEPGDLLTTSDVPGHAMKVSDHDMAQGAILGKAMTRLEAGERGMVLVLVSLQ